MSIRRFGLDRLLAAISLAWVVAVLAIPALQGTVLPFTLTLALLVANTVVSLVTLVRDKRVSVLLNFMQVGLFAAANLQLFHTSGANHYQFHHVPATWDWLQLAGAHVLKAIDVLDFLEDYGIQLQNVRHAGAVSGVLLVTLHLLVGVFLVAGLLRWFKQLRRRFAQDDGAGSGGVLRLAGTAVRAFRGVGLAASVVAVAVVAWRDGWRAADWLLWPLDNLLRVLDVADAMQIFGWRLHGVPAAWGVLSLGIALRLFAGLYLAEWVGYLHLRLLGARALRTLEDMIDDLKGDNPLVRRQAAEALGYLGLAAAPAIPALARLLDEGDRPVKESAADALGRIGPSAVPVLQERLGSRDPVIRDGVVAALGRVGAPALLAVTALLDAESSDGEGHPTLLEVLGRIGLPALPRLLDELRRCGQFNAGKVIAEALARIGAAAVPDLVTMLISQNLELVPADVVAEALGRIGPPAIPPIARRLSDEQASVRQAAVEALSRMDRYGYTEAIKPALPALLERLSDSDPGVSRWVAETFHGEAGEKLVKMAGPSLRQLVPTLRALVAPLDDRAEAAIKALDAIDGDWGDDPECRALLAATIRRLEDPDRDVRWRAARVLGRLGEKAREAVPLLTHRLDHDSVGNRHTAAWALGRIGGEAALRALARVAAAEEAGLRAAAIEALGEPGVPLAEALPLLMSALGDPNSVVRGAAATSLARAAPVADRVVPALTRALGDPAWEVQGDALRTLARFGPLDTVAAPAVRRLLGRKNSEAVEALVRIGPPSVPPLREALDDPEDHVRLNAARALLQLGEQEGVLPVLLGLLKSERYQVVELLGEMGPSARSAVPALVGLLKACEWDRRRPILRAIGQTGAEVPFLFDTLDGEERQRGIVARVQLLRDLGHAAVPTLVAALAARDWNTRAVAAESLGRLGAVAEAAVPDLARALADRPWRVRAASAEALGRIGPLARAAVPGLLRVVLDREWYVRASALQALEQLGAEALPGVTAALDDRSWRLRGAAVVALARLARHVPEAVPALTRASGDKRRGVRKAAEQALAEVTPAHRGGLL